MRLFLKCYCWSTTTMQGVRIRKCLLVVCFFLMMLNVIVFETFQRKYEGTMEENQKTVGINAHQQTGLKDKTQKRASRYQLSSDNNSSYSISNVDLTRIGVFDVTESTKVSSTTESVLVDDRASKLSKLKQASSGILRIERKGNPVKFGLSPKTMTKLFDTMIDWFTIGGNTPKDDLLNHHNFKFQLNSKLCTSNNDSVLIIINSAASNFRKRTRIRETWGRVRHGMVKPTTVFMLGTHSIPKLYQKKIVEESQLYDDIVQGDFIDSYKNLTYKHIMALHWATVYCQHVKTLVKLDDDVFVDVYKLVNFSSIIGPYENTLYCSVLKKIFPMGYGKWALTMYEYPFAFFPSYCEGMVYITTIDVARKLVRASKDMASFWIDDIFVTGILARKAEISHKGFLEGHKPIKRNSVVKGGITSVDLSKHMFFTEFSNWDYLMKELI